MKLIDEETLNTLCEKARRATRRRTNLNLHEQYDEPVQRMAVAMEPDSYVRPHRHSEAHKWEWLSVLRGRFALLIFDEEGKVVQRHVLASEGPVHVVEFAPNTWHTLVALESGSVFFEVKRGPYTPLMDKDFASWSPPEQSESVAAFLTWLQQATEGDTAPTNFK